MLATSLDGQWAIIRRGREVTLLAKAAAPAVGRITLEEDEVDLAFVGPPSVLVAVSRGASGSKVTLYQTPQFEAGARLELDQPMKLAAVSGSRVVLLSGDGKTARLVRVAARALAWAGIDPGGVVEFAVGLEKNQILFSLPKKLEVWDAIAARPLQRMQLQLPPGPRVVGTAHGHLWVRRPGTDEVYVYRLSDGRPFQHYAGSPIEDIVSHPASPVLVLITARGLIRLHCFAHSLTSVETPWVPGMPLAQLGAGDDVSLIGIGPADDEPWRVRIGGGDLPASATTSATDKQRARRTPVAGVAITDASPAPAAPDAPERARAPAWRDPLATFALDFMRSVRPELPMIPVDSELGELARWLALPSGARRALITLYSLYLVGDPTLTISRLALALGDWTEPLGQGELAALAMLRRKDGKVGLRRAVTDYLDGLAPRAIRFVGDATTSSLSGASRLARDGKSDAAIESELSTKLGQIAVLEGSASRGVIEARLHGVTLVAHTAPRDRPEPWPRDAGLIVVGDADVPAWVAALPPTAS